MTNPESNLKARKSQLTRRVREMVLDRASTRDDRCFRPNAANGYIATDEVFLCFNIQYTQWRIDESLAFCINFGALPKRLFDANWDGHCNKHPKAGNGVFQSRLHPDHGCGEYWWTVAAGDPDQPVLAGISDAVDRVAGVRMSDLRSEQACLNSRNISAPIYRERLEKWLQLNA